MTDQYSSPSAPREKTGILLAAFGASTPVGERGLQFFSEEVRRRFPLLPLRQAFTSPHMRNRLAKAKVKSDSVKKALTRMGFERFTHVAVQPLQIIPGSEYETLLEEVEDARKNGGPRNITVGFPLLHTKEDVKAAAAALLRHLPEERNPRDAVACMGHGTWHSGAASYEALASAVRGRDAGVFIGTLEGEHALPSLLPLLLERAEETGSRKVWLLPLLSVIGKHAQEDMAGAGEDSWKSRIAAAGLEPLPVLHGTAEYQGFADIWLDHLNEAVKELA